MSQNGDPRRVFIPTPSAPPANGRGRAPVQSPPRRGAPEGLRPPRPAPPSRRPQPGGPTRPYPDGPGGPGGTPPGTPRGRGRPWWKRIRWKRVAIALPIILLLLLIGGWWWANSIFDKIERVEVSDALSSGGSGTNYLIVGSDSRDVLDANDPELDQDIEAPPGGQRADTMMLLRFDEGKAKIMSIPRDLWVVRADNGEEGKINGSYNGGPKALISTIQDNLEIPIHRYMEVDFVSFAGLVDGLGGITIEFANPAFDTNSGLNVTQSGPVKLDGEQALAYVRSRHYVEIVNGEEVPDPQGDLGRIVRQQTFMKAVFAKLGDAKNPFAMARIADKVSDGLRIDDGMSLWNAMNFAWKLRGMQTEPVDLHVETGREGRASVVKLTDASQASLDIYR